MDFNSSLNNNQDSYWAINFINNYKEPKFYFYNINFAKKHNTGDSFKNFKKLYIKNKKFTLIFSSNKAVPNFEINELLIENEKINNKSNKNILKDKPKTKISEISKNYNLAFLYWNKNIVTGAKLEPSWYNLINLNFIRKERLYTKLKYSRSPAYDLVSGGAAALLAGFIGFLVSEKFGYELGDSGDFYFLFMYIVILAFSVKPILYTTDLFEDKSFIDSFSLKYFFNFYIDLITVFIIWIKLFLY